MSTAKVHTFTSESRTDLYGAAMRALQAAAAQYRLPRSFTRDLTVWDRRALAQNGEGPFAWCLQKDGTHMIRSVLGSITLGATLLENHVKSGCFEKTALRFWWDGKELHPCTDSDDCIERMRSYEDDLRAGHDLSKIGFHEARS